MSSVVAIFFHGVQFSPTSERVYALFESAPDRLAQRRTRAGRPARGRQHLQVPAWATGKCLPALAVEMDATEYRPRNG